MAEDNNGYPEIQISSFLGGRDHQLVIRGRDPYEVEATVISLTADGVGPDGETTSSPMQGICEGLALISGIATLAGLLPQQQAAPAGNQGGGFRGRERSAGGNGGYQGGQRGAGATRQCSVTTCGAMANFVSGISKAGREYKGYKCPACNNMDFVR